MVTESKSKATKVKFEEGDVFVVPLRSHGYGLGLIARKNKDIILGYFFNIRFDELPGCIDYDLLEKHRVIFAKQFGSPGLKGGTWVIIGHLQNWKREDWPVPTFCREDPLLGIYFAVHYNDNLECIGEEKIPESLAAKMYKDSLAGYGSIEKTLTEFHG